MRFIAKLFDARIFCVLNIIILYLVISKQLYLKLFIRRHYVTIYKINLLIDNFKAFDKSLRVLLAFFFL